MTFSVARNSNDASLGGAARRSLASARFRRPRVLSFGRSLRCRPLSPLPLYAAPTADTVTTADGHQLLGIRPTSYHRCAPTILTRGTPSPTPPIFTRASHPLRGLFSTLDAAPEGSYTHFSGLLAPAISGEDDLREDRAIPIAALCAESFIAGRPSNSLPSSAHTSTSDCDAVTLRRTKSRR